ncbi:MAG: hypothetical protein HRT87_03190, partial [Legionellales bacterium]|nr:hypothetical protein [Legionellales bacterium]
MLIAVEKLGYTPIHSEITMIADRYVEVDQDNIEMLIKLEYNVKLATQ